MSGAAAEALLGRADAEQALGPAESASEALQQVRKLLFPEHSQFTTSLHAFQVGLVLSSTLLDGIAYYVDVVFAAARAGIRWRRLRSRRSCEAKAFCNRLER